VEIEIIEESADYLVANKPAPMLIHPKVPGNPPTLLDHLQGLLSYEVASGGQVSIINRLDRETSGAVLIAKNKETARRFSTAMKERLFGKKYLAICIGHPAEDELENHGAILRKGEVTDSPIWVKQLVHEDGNACSTKFKVLERFIHKQWALPLSLLEATPLTGRMHQIRVHAADLGFPLLGDKLYGEDETCYLDFIEEGWSKGMQERLRLRSHALHSWKLMLPQEQQEWIAPLRHELSQILDLASGS